MAPVGFLSSDLLVGLRRMRVFILAFSFGVLLLQTRGELPDWGVLAALAVVGGLFFAGANRFAGERRGLERAGLTLAGLAIVAALGTILRRRKRA